MLEKQIDKSHYKFSKYVTKERWLSIWHQIDEVLSLSPRSVLEIGPGPGLFKVLAVHFGIAIETVDIDPELNPDHVASAIDLPFTDNSYDCVCAFQVLEHIPYNQSLKAFVEMVRVAKEHIIISLPDVKILWTYSLYIPKIGQVIFFIPKPRLRRQTKHFDIQHYWEINKQGYTLQKIIDDFTSQNVKLLKTYRVKEFTKHRFFLFKKIIKET